MARSAREIKRVAGARLALLLALSALATGCAWLRPDLAARVATGTVAHDLCSGTFVSGANGDRLFAESLAPRAGLRLVAPLLRYRIDPTHGSVHASLGGGFASTAVYRGEQGCLLVRHPPGAADVFAPPAAPLAAPPVATAPALVAALDQAFAEAPSTAPRNTRAVVIMQGGRVVAERYGAGIGPATPLLGFSLGKSVVGVLAGMMIADGTITLDTPLLPGRTGAIPTVAQALRMTTGLDLDETGSGFDAATRMLYVHADDMAGFARQAVQLAPPGQRWAYSSATTHLLARLLTERVGGAAAMRRYARERLFAPLGMTTVTMEADATGTPVGAHYVLASARDWAQLGQLYLRDGVAASGRRIVPAGWVRWSTSPTLDTDYGAGWWLNRRNGGPPRHSHDMPLLPSAPADTFYGLGNLGQYLLVVPSIELVIVRLGAAHTPDFDSAATDRLVGAVISALGQTGRAVAPQAASH